MNKKELAAELAKRQGFKKSEVLDLINEMVDVIEGKLSEGGEVRISGIGRFFTKERASSKGRNPHTGEALQLESRTVPRFQFSDKLKRSTKKD
jgi:nucleoid DNA-binding protein